MSELENCCGTTCDKQKLAEELDKQYELIQALTEILDVHYPHEIFDALSEIQINKAYLETEYANICKLLPNDARYLDPPDGGSVKPSEQMRRMINDLQEQIKNCNNETLANRIVELSRTVSTLDAQINRVLNERVDIENILSLVGAGKLPLLTARDCQVLAIKLGTPKKHWSDVIKNYKLENLQ